MRKTYYVYILASKSGTLYVGVTNNLERRLAEHRLGAFPGFTKRYGVHRLVHVEANGDVTVAIAREKQIKAWRRCKKVALVESTNPTWRDLNAAGHGTPPGHPDAPRVPPSHA